MLDVSKHFGPKIAISELVIGFIYPQVTSCRVIVSSNQDLMPQGSGHDQLCPRCGYSSISWNVNVTQDTIWIQKIVLNGV